MMHIFLGAKCRVNTFCVLRESCCPPSPRRKGSGPACGRSPPHSHQGSCASLGKGHRRQVWLAVVLTSRLAVSLVTEVTDTFTAFYTLHPAPRLLLCIPCLLAFVREGSPPFSCPWLSAPLPAQPQGSKLQAPSSPRSLHPRCSLGKLNRVNKGRVVHSVPLVNVWSPLCPGARTLRCPGQELVDPLHFAPSPKNSHHVLWFSDRQFEVVGDCRFPQMGTKEGNLPRPCTGTGCQEPAVGTLLWGP